MGTLVLGAFFLLCKLLNSLHYNIPEREGKKKKSHVFTEPLLRKGSMPDTLRDIEMFKAPSCPEINISLLYIFTFRLFFFFFF